MAFSSDWVAPGQSNQKTHEHVYLAGSVVAIIDHDWPSNAVIATNYQHTDALGSPVAVTNAAGTVIERNDYEPYGAVIGKPAYSGIGYTGHVMDGGTGLTYMLQRYYDQSIGRFLSVDPVTADSGNGANFNRYWYGNNNPYVFVDPEGMCTGSHIENKDGTCAISGDFTTQGIGPTMPGAQAVVHQASIEAQAGVSGAGGMSRLYAANDGVREPLYCDGGADCDFMYNQQEFLAGRISNDEFTDRTVAQGTGGMIGAAAGLVIASGPEGWATVRTIYQFIKLGREISFGKDVRIAPFGNRTGHQYGRWPHYHRRGTDASGQTRPGQGIGRHRPFEKKSTDKSFWDRF